MALIIPAIDIMGGRAVRLLKGEFSKKTDYGDPRDVAAELMRLGASYLHIVDLDGARRPVGAAESHGTLEQRPADNYDVIAEIAKLPGLHIQVGGGIRTRDDVERYLNIADRVILGTSAAQSPGFAAACVRNYGADRIVVSVDVADGEVAIGGWSESSGIAHLTYIETLKGSGVETVVVTDVSRDGTLSSPNWEMYGQIRGINVIVSGGIACDEDVLAAQKYYGVIIGKAYYEGKVNLKWLLQNA